MQRPRRTSEFFDENTAASSSRKSRTTQRLPTTPSTIQKYSTRRTALGTRNSSFDRGLGAPSATRGTTPSHSTPASRSLFPTSSVSGSALHNDKKWIQEQTQRLTDHLKRAIVLGCGNLEFINHTGLKQMSIKQFVAVVNYLLHFVAGNRLTVGTNHVDDIVNVLQILQYPYAINKSWLKTPNTQHSFGNVMLLLSWLLDFAPQQLGEEIDVECYFSLQDPHEIKNTSEAPSFIADSDFQLQMMQHCEEGFALWNNELMKEYLDMQQKTGDLFISKRTNFRSASALERDIQRLGEQLEALKEKCRPVPKSEKELQQQLTEERKSLLQSQKMLQHQLQELCEHMRALEMKYETCHADVHQLEEEVAQIRRTIQEQKYTTADRDALVESVDMLKHTLQSQERTLSELQEQNYRKQVELSRLKKKQTDDIEAFNAHVRELNEISIDMQATRIDCSQLQLPLNVEAAQMHQVQSLLGQVNEELHDKLEAQNRDIEILSRALESNEEKISLNIKRDYEMTVAKLQLTEKTLKQQEMEQQARLEDLMKRHEKLKIEISQIEIAVLQTVENNVQNQQKLIGKQAANENIMLEAEYKHRKNANEHEEYLNNFERQLDENMSELYSLEKLVVENEKILNNQD